MRDEQHLYYLLRALIAMAKADEVIAREEEEILQHIGATVGIQSPEIWPRVWREVHQLDSLGDAFSDIPDDPRLVRFILREMASLACSDGDLADTERQLLYVAAEAFGLGHVVERHIAWAEQLHAVHVEGEALLEA